jgi:hypothetical protein
MSHLRTWRRSSPQPDPGTREESAMKRRSKNVLQRVLAALLLAPASPMAQSLIVNGDFDTGLDGWEFPDATPAWSPLDAGDSAQSGSAHGVNMSTSGRVCVLRQCVALPRSGRQVLSVWAYTPPGQGLGNLVLSYTARRNAPDCTGGSFASGGTYLPSVGAWTYHALSVPVDDPPAPDTTVDVRLCVDPARQVGFGGHFDRVRLVPDVIFRDGTD